MGFVNGFISCAISDEGHSDVVRVNFANRDKMMYSIDSDNVEGLRVFQNAKEIEIKTNPAGGKTFVQFLAEPNNWFGMVYRRNGFVTQKHGVWEYLDNWQIPDDMVYMLMLPKYALIESLNISGHAREQHKFNDHLVLTQYFSGGNLLVNTKYVFDSRRYALLDLPELVRSSFPYAGINPNASEVFGTQIEDSTNVRKVTSTVASSLDWVGRAVTLYEALHYLGLL